MGNLDLSKKYKGLINRQDWETGTLKLYKDDLTALCREDKHFYVFKESVSKFTGLVNDSGKEIYEGDILRLEGKKDNEVVVVFWDDSGQQWKAGSLPLQDPDLSIPLENCLNGVVVGHEYTHQHLLHSIKIGVYSEKT